MTRNALKNLSSTKMESVATRFRALGEVSRLLLIQALLTGKKTVTELVEHTGLSQPNVSKHLAVLTGAGLLERKKEGLNVLYSVSDQSLAEICLIVCKSISK